MESGVMTTREFNRELARAARRAIVQQWLGKIGNIPACKRRDVVRGFVDLFRNGFAIGHGVGFDAGRRHEKRRARRRGGAE